MSLARLSRLLLRALIGLLALFVLMLLALWLLLPRWIEGSGSELASQALGRQVQIEHVSFEPWRLGLVVEGLRVAGVTPKSDALLSVARIDVAVSLRSLLHLAPVVASLRVVQPVVHLARTAPGHYDIDDLIQRFTAPSPTPQKPGEQADFALYNLQLEGGQVVFDDQPVARQQRLDQLAFDLPFVSTFDTDEKVEVRPHLSGRLNGVAFGGQGEAQPFLKNGQSDGALKFVGLDLAPYLPYLPADLPLHVDKGHLDADLQLAFSQQTLRLTGRVALNDAALSMPDGQPWLAWQRLAVELKDVQPLRRSVSLTSITLDGADLSLQRLANGALWMPRVAAPAATPASVPKRQTPAAPWIFALDHLGVNGATIHWRDKALRPQLDLTAQTINVQLDALQWPLKNPARLQYALDLGDAKITGKGQLDPAHATVGLQWQDIALAPLAPYAQGAVHARIKGLFSGRAELNVDQPLQDDAAARAMLALSSLALRQVAVQTPQGEPVFEAKAITLDKLEADMATRHLSLGRLSLQQPRVQDGRDARGQWHHAALLPASSAAPEHAAPAASSSAPAWSVQAEGFDLTQGQALWRDAAVGDGAQIDVGQIELHLGAISWPKSVSATPLRLSLSLGAPKARVDQRGRLQWQGHVGLTPLSAQGTLRSNQLPLQVLSAYLDPAWNLRLRRAELGLKGRISARQTPAGWAAQWSGDALLGDLRLQQLRDGDGQNLLSWGALNLDGLKFAMVPGAAPRVDIAQVRLDDFFAQLLVNERGQLNLKEVGPQGEAVVPASAASAAVSTPVAPSPPASAPALQIAIGRTLLSKGHVDFTDHFVKPNYNAQLTELEGQLGAFASDKPDLADVDLHGRVAGTGLLAINGKVNPAASPPQMDLSASATDIELAPLSPYAAKYVGYDIERGKLSTKLHYRIDAAGQLQADNHVILNQLDFGAAVDSPDATKLPVRLAVALLKDSHGVIDVNLPISGSVNDPQFSVGGLVFKLIINLIGKALTSPFSLFAGSGTTDLSQLAFAPGAPRLQDPAQIDTLAKLLQDRPAVTLTITGWADLAHERAALQARALDAAIEREQRRELRRSQLGKTPSDADAPLPALSNADRNRLLTLVYAAAKLPNKPTNLIGFAKEIAPDQMRALLLPSYAVDAQAIHDLALQRSVGVRDALVAQGVASSRLFLAAPHDDSVSDEAWKPHVDLKLGAQ